MKEDIYSIFSVEKSIGEYTGDGFIVEECSGYDAALVDYKIIMNSYEMDNLKQWVSENCRQASKHVISQLDNGQYANAMSLIKTLIKVKNFTEWYVSSQGSIQGFLDHWGGDGINSEPVMDREEDTEADVLADLSASVIFKDDEDEQPIQQGINFLNPEEDLNGEDFVFKDEEESVQESVDEPTDDSDTEDLSDIIEDESTDESGELANEDGADGFAEDVAIEAQLASNVVEPVDGLEVPFVQNTEGKMVLPYHNLLEFANFIRNAANALESEDVPETELLTSKSKDKALEFLGEFAPSVFKEFVMHYVNSAETSLDYVRVTKMLDSFCVFVDGRNRMIREVADE